MGGSAKGGSQAQSKAGTVSYTPPVLIETAEELNQMGIDQYNLGFPTLERGAGIATDVLGQGFSKSLVPAITSLIQQSTMQSSQQMKTLQEQLVRQGITGTEYQSQLAGQRAQGGMAAAQIPFQVGQPILEAAGKTAFELPLKGMETEAAGGQVLAGMSDKYTAAKGAGEIVGRTIGGVVGYFTGDIGAGADAGGGLLGGLDPDPSQSGTVQGATSPTSQVGTR